jgi:hypothetical protein
MNTMFIFSTRLVDHRLVRILVFGLCLGVLFAGQAQAQDPKLLGMGDSLGEAVQSADASYRTQPFSYLKFMARQMGADFPLPLIRSGPFGVIGDTTLRYRLRSGVRARNLSVSGADVSSMLREQADARWVGEIDSETDLVLFPRLGSPMEIAESIGAPLVVCWIGNNDVLSTVLSFDALDASQMTPVEEFEPDFQEIVQRLGAFAEVVVFGNIPDVTKIGFLMDRQDLIRFLGSDFGLAEGDFTTIVAMLLIRLGLDDGSLVQDPDFVLDAAEVGLIRERTDIFNQIIADAAGQHGMAVVDIHAMFDELAENPPIFFGIPVTPRFLGGIFSLDAVHPSNIGHALVANAFIETLNSRFHADIPPISDWALRWIFLTDPFQDKDGDLRVRGRFGAGLMETLGPILGISGDTNDFVPQGYSTTTETSVGKRFMERFLAGQGTVPDVASEWNRWDGVSAFKHILGVRDQRFR